MLISISGVITGSHMIGLNSNINCIPSLPPTLFVQTPKLVAPKGHLWRRETDYRVCFKVQRSETWKRSWQASQRTHGISTNGCSSTPTLKLYRLGLPSTAPFLFWSWPLLRWFSNEWSLKQQLLHHSWRHCTELLLYMLVSMTKILHRYK